MSHRVLAGAVAVQMTADHERGQDDVDLANREAAEPCRLGGRQPQAGKVSVFSREPCQRGDTSVEIQSKHELTVRLTRLIDK